MAVVKGAAELVGKLQKLKKTVLKKAIRKGSRAGAKIVQQQAKADAPRRTGALAAALKVRALPRSRRWVGTQVTAKVEGGVFYAGFIEYGTKRIKARHFIRDAAIKVKSAAGSAFVEGIKEVIASDIGH